MCFSMEMSASFAAVGLFSSWWIYSRTSNTALASGVFFFFTMELLQAIQYFFIAPNIDSPICDTFMNQFLTVLGFLHICLQPYFCHVINASLTKNAKYLDRYLVIKRLCLIGGGMLFTRFLLAHYWDQTLGNQPSTEWLRGEKLCTFRGNYHLAWSIPMADPTYVIPGAAIHSFLMFAPFFALYEKKGMVLQGVFLFVFGPYTAGLITSNLMEQASIWCFFSISQIAIMLFCIRETLIINWGREGPHESLLSSRKKETDKPVEKKNFESLSKKISSEAKKSA
eukprot:TRINITY_DN185_c0_g1_i1.p2 TRINITY_DN185_c0_g1~~TRINITY_DN185_c0_g1_i1.p2  ORF type:complete len:282 (+),score=65.92 TRINITY_DN185_c0_g1_i1:86-931(+)